MSPRNMARSYREGSSVSAAPKPDIIGRYRRINIFSVYSSAQRDVSYYVICCRFHTIFIIFNRSLTGCLKQGRKTMRCHCDPQWRPKSRAIILTASTHGLLRSLYLPCHLVRGARGQFCHNTSQMCAFNLSCQCWKVCPIYNRYR